MNDAEESVAAVFNGQRIEDVVRRLHISNRFAALTGPHAVLALEMERDFVFGMMSEARANECRALYDFIFHGVDFVSHRTTMTDQEVENSGQSNDKA